MAGTCVPDLSNPEPSEDIGVVSENDISSGDTGQALAEPSGVSGSGGCGVVGMPRTSGGWMALLCVLGLLLIGRFRRRLPNLRFQNSNLRTRN